MLAVPPAAAAARLPRPASASSTDPDPPAEGDADSTASRLSPWSDGEPRLFVSARLELGLYMKPQVAVGYGKPYWLWVGMEAYPMSTLSFGAGYAGVRAVLPFADLRVGARDTFSYYRTFLTPADRFVAGDVDSLHGGLNARYATLEAELVTALPIPTGYVVFSVAAYDAFDAPREKYLYEESLRGVMRPPYIAGGRLAYVMGFGRADFVKIGLLGEAVLLVGREATIWRVGPVAEITLTDHLDAQAALTGVVSSPDALGTWDGPFGVLGLVYRWASGDPHPAFP